MVVLVYVDDLIIAGSSNHAISQLKGTLQSHFPIKDLVHLNYFLEIEMAASSKGLFLNQQNYILDLLEDAEMTNYKSAHTPLDSKLNLDKTSAPL